MSEANATVPTQGSPDDQAPRTFTQDEVNAIVGKRLAEEKGKYADYETLKAKATKYDEAEEASKSELQKATERANALEAELGEMKKAESVRQIREKVSQETGVPIGLLSCDTEEACTEQAKSILAFAQPNSYPKVKDGGEAKQTSDGKTRDQFADWFTAAVNH